MTAIQIEQLTKTYNHVPSVNGIDFSVQEGEIVALLGPSGCGKTTTLRMIAGLTMQSDGSIYFDQKKVDTIPAHKRNVGMVFQEYALFPHLNVEQNILFGVKKKKNKQEILENVLSLVALEGFEKRYPHELSGGQQQRVALARALAPSPSILLMDEPFSNLDEELKYTMRLEVKRILKQANITTIFVTHDQKDALAIADRIIIMNEGKIEQIGTPEHIYRYPETNFVAKFLTRANVLRAKQGPNQIESTIGVLPVKEVTGKTDGFIVIPRDAFTVSNDGAFQGIVTHSSFEGEYSELICDVNGEKMAMLFYGEAPCQVKDTIQFHIKDYRFIAK